MLLTLIASGSPLICRLPVLNKDLQMGLRISEGGGDREVVETLHLPAGVEGAGVLVRPREGDVQVQLALPRFLERVQALQEQVRVRAAGPLPVPHGEALRAVFAAALAAPHVVPLEVAQLALLHPRDQRETMHHPHRAGLRAV
eukprot:CAMPEP_0118954024 /NCGR_PEP_ID=MMETSP1169-20130426/57567_1 /TAXON_ID=36882 /ORGANISM="Pyramimonas obovata, Strain CCMP722" /LENGTH=142 /DNA_ID=CAMNT_0006901593 /DNA_START=217 /DNA_END=645 /DNA_ORIENTATION=+